MRKKWGFGMKGFRLALGKKIKCLKPVINHSSLQLLLSFTWSNPSRTHWKISTSHLQKGSSRTDMYRV